MQQSKLFDNIESDELESMFEVGKAVRNATYQIIKPHLCETRQRVYEIILQHPEGICNKQIALEWGVPINCVTGRVTELRKEGLVDACGTKAIPDHRGRMHPNTLWRAL